MCTPFYVHSYLVLWFQLPTSFLSVNMMYKVWQKTSVTRVTSTDCVLCLLSITYMPSIANIPIMAARARFCLRSNCPRRGWSSRPIQKSLHIVPETAKTFWTLPCWNTKKFDASANVSTCLKERFLVFHLDIEILPSDAIHLWLTGEFLPMTNRRTESARARMMSAVTNCK